MTRNDQGVFVCPYGDGKQYSYPDTLKRHVKNTRNISEKDDGSSDDDSLFVDDAVNVSLNVKTTLLRPKDQTENETNTKQYEYKTSVLSAFDALQQSEKEQEEKLLIAELGDLEPVVYVDCKGKEHHLLAAPKVISRMMTLEVENQSSSIIFIPKKRKQADEDSQPHLPLCSLRNVILNSHCKALLASNYIELDVQTSLLLNSSWNLNPLAAKMCAHLLEEVVFLERNQCLLILTGEIYSRLPSLDAHYEKTSASKGNIPQSSLPHVNTRYQNIELCLIVNDNAKKLVLGTKTMNVLFTSSMRLDINQSVAVGASSANDFIPSRNTRIFIEKSKLEQIERMAKESKEL